MRQGERSRWEALKIEVHNDLAKHIDAATVADSDKRKIAEMREHVHEFVQRAAREAAGPHLDGVIEPLCDEVMDEVVGFGPLESLLAEANVSEIMVNGPERSTSSAAASIKLTDKTFLDDERIARVIERIIAPIGRRGDEASPLVDAPAARRLARERDHRAVSLDGPVITIRSFGKRPLQVDDLVDGRLIARTSSSSWPASRRGSTSSSPAAPAAARRRC